MNKMVQDVKKFTGIDDVVTLECYNRKLNYGGGKTPIKMEDLMNGFICLGMLLIFVWITFHATVFALKFKKKNLYMH